MAGKTWLYGFVISLLCVGYFLPRQTAFILARRRASAAAWIAAAASIRISRRDGLC